MSPRPVSRRQAVTLGGLGAAALAAGAAGWTTSATAGSSATADTSGGELAQPRMLSSAAA